MDTRSGRFSLWQPVAICVAIAMAVALSSCASAAPDEGRGATPEPISTELALQTFDSAWSRINDSYYDPGFRGIDWAGIRDELRPSAARATTKAELREILQDMLSRLGESHFAIIPRDAVDAITVEDDGTADAAASGLGEVGLEVRWVDDELAVFRVTEGTARDAGVRAGWVVDRIGEREIARWREVRAEAEPGRERISIETETIQGADALLAGPAGTAVEVAFRDGDGAERVLELERRPVRGQLVQFGQLPPMVSSLDYRRVEQPGGCVGVIEFNIWMVPLVAPFNEAVDELADCVGMVIDVRGNLGGVGGMVMSTAGSFFGERSELGTIESRAGDLNFVAMPRQVDTRGDLRPPFEGRLAILIDQMSMSTSEIFAAGLKSTGRARLFGQTTPGYALPAVTLPLPSGDVLYHVVSNLTDPAGVRIEGLGVAPDVEIPLDRVALLEGRDEVLDAAIAWAAGETN
jgi:carboxyl-terminal processing protease